MSTKLLLKQKDVMLVHSNSDAPCEIPHRTPNVVPITNDSSSSIDDLLNEECTNEFEWLAHCTVHILHTRGLVLLPV